MASLIPPQFLFRYTFPVVRLDRLPRRGKRLLKLPPECVLPDLSELSGSTPFAELRVAWNENGLGIGIAVSGKSQPVACHPDQVETSDGVRIWIDTRNTQSIHRASRFCHQFVLLPTVGQDGASPLVVPTPIARANEDAPRIDAELIPIQSGLTAKGYWVDAWLPTAALNGYDPSRQPKLGFYYAVQDQELGLQTLSVGSEFPFASDPSLWATLELVDAPGDDSSA